MKPKKNKIKLKSKMMLHITLVFTLLFCVLFVVADFFWASYLRTAKEREMTLLANTIVNGILHDVEINDYISLRRSLYNLYRSSGLVSIFTIDKNGNVLVSLPNEKYFNAKFDSVFLDGVGDGKASVVAVDIISINQEYLGKLYLKYSDKYKSAPLWYSRVIALCIVILIIILLLFVLERINKRLLNPLNKFIDLNKQLSILRFQFNVPPDCT